MVRGQWASLARMPGFIPAPRSGVCVTKHASQLSLACFVNTRKVIGLSSEIPLVSHTDITSNVTD